MSLYHLYCDESSTDKGHSHMVFAGALASADNAARFSRGIDVWRKQVSMTKELKWTKVTNDKLNQYTSFVNGAFSRIEQNDLFFRSVVFPVMDIDYAKFHSGSKDLGYYKLMYTFIVNSFPRFLKADDKLLIFMDEQSSNQSLETLKTCLNKTIFRQLGRSEQVRNIQPVDSKQSNMIQLVDVLMGAVAFHNNRRHLQPDCRESKKTLAMHIAKRAGYASLAVSTPKHRPNFGIWQFQFGAKKERPKT